ncbi:hypothetical protein RDI58_000847 [Solanum bulbocastanum]|uniref:Pentatricopeptide repeat-containing protein n=1 Tax=Solanum bulbocastanum TaxID=147425 RepID=A0AAN8U6X6_SOLBU
MPRVFAFCLAFQSHNSQCFPGYLSNLPSDALLLFQCVKLANEKPNSVTLVSLLGACTRILNIRLGKCIHSHIVTSGIELHVELETALLGMYAKCGHIQQAFYIFNSMDDKNLQTWAIMISGLADHGHVEEAVSLFARMEESGFRPDSLSFSIILYACSHIGIVDAGREYFEKMASLYNIRPTMEHYGCMVDMSMPTEPNSVILRSFISACKHHGHIPCAEENIREILLKIEPDLGSNYALASSLFYLLRCEQPKIGYESKRDKEISWQQLEEAIQITGMKALLHSKDERTLSMVEENELLLFGSWDALKVAPQHGLKLWLKTMRYSHGETI